MRPDFADATVADGEAARHWMARFLWRRLTREGVSALLIRAVDEDYSLQDVRKGAPPMTTKMRAAAIRPRLSAPSAGRVPLEQ